MMNTPTPASIRLRAVDFDRLEQDLANEAKKIPVPQETVRKTGTAVSEQFKLAAESVTSMGDEIHERIKRLEAGLADCYDVLRIIQEASDAIRAKGTHVQLLIDEAAATSNEIRAGVAKMLENINR